MKAQGQLANRPACQTCPNADPTWKSHQRLRQRQARIVPNLHRVDFPRLGGGERAERISRSPGWGPQPIPSPPRCAASVKPLVPRRPRHPPCGCAHGAPARPPCGFRISRRKLMKAPARQGNRGAGANRVASLQLASPGRTDVAKRSSLYPPWRSRPISAANAWINSNFRRSQRPRRRTNREPSD
jgi:hypothetical protein